MKRFLIIFLGIITTCIFSSCATVFNGSKTRINVKNGTPQNAKVYVDGNYIGTAPCKAKIPKTVKGAQHIIDIKAEGYETASITTNRKLSVGYLVLDIITGVVWTAIDFATGNIYMQKPKKIEYNLEKKQ